MGFNADKAGYLSIHNITQQVGIDFELNRFPNWFVFLSKAINRGRA